MTEAHESVHEGELPRIVEFEARNALSGGGDRRLRQLSQLPSIKERFDDVLLDVQVIVVDCREGAAQGRQIIDSLPDAVVGDVVGCRLGAQDEVIAHVLLDEAVAIMAADHRVGEVHVFDLCLQLAVMELADLAAEDRRDLVGLADGAIGVEEPLAEPVECGATMEDEIVEGAIQTDAG